MEKDMLSTTNFADKAEKVMLEIKDVRRKITTSQIRNILTMTNNLYDRARMGTEQLSDDELSDLQYYKMRVVYEAGRDNLVKDFVDKANLLEHIKQINRDREKLLVYCKYFESLVAYHKYYGGRD
ncbi:MAG: type III-A CRISPR-associated protein Csm2 [Tissierellia bacterium]|nr:type III-A CRISPR-associated protein Csm2 [Tissierellia bacterium]